MNFPTEQRGIYMQFVQRGAGEGFKLFPTEFASRKGIYTSQECTEKSE